MKKITRKASVTAAWICIAPLLLVAESVAGQAPSVKESIGRLTLLPGPSLLSPARTTPTLMPSPMKLENAMPAPTTPAVPLFLSGGGSLRLIERPQVTPSTRSYRTPSTPSDRSSAEPAHPIAPPTPESLRFDATLEPPPSSIRVKLKSG